MARIQVKQKRVLSKVPIFSELGADCISKIVDIMEYASYAAGDVLCREKETADKLFVIVRGACHVNIEALRGQRIATLSTGDIFGESALAENASDRIRGATVTSAGLEDSPETPTAVLELFKADFDELVRSGVLDSSVVEQVSAVKQVRDAANKILLAKAADNAVAIKVAED